MQATDRVNADDPELFVDDEDSTASPDASVPDLPPWRILIADDDVDVHVVTKFALSNTNFQGRRLSFFHAYTGAEALEKLRDTPDIALVLLDVVMETTDAGLQVARQVRDALHNELVRIVLRTGQPGQSFEHGIIVDYDITDFWSKADLTTRKLITTVIASLRAYTTLAAAARARDSAMLELERTRQALTVLDRHALVLTLDVHGHIIEANPHFCTATGTLPDQLPGRDLHAVYPDAFPEPLASGIVEALSRNGVWQGDIRATLATGPCELRCSIQAFKGENGARPHYIAIATPLTGGN